MCRLEMWESCGRKDDGEKNDKNLTLFTLNFYAYNHNDFK